MDRKTKRILRKSEVAPQRKEQVNLTDRIQDAINKLKRYESPETMREVNKICTPVSCPAYPIMKKFNKTKREPGARYIVDENSKTRVATYGVAQNPSPFNSVQVGNPSNNSPRELRKVLNLFQPKEISLATYLKNNAKDAVAGLKIPGQGNYQMPNQSKPKKRRSRSGQSARVKASAQISDKNRRHARQVDRNKSVFKQNETAVTYATIIPVHEMMMNKQPRKKFTTYRRPRKHSRTKQNAASQSTNANDTINFHQKRLIRKNMFPNNQQNKYYANAADSPSNTETKVHKPKRNKKRKVVRKRMVPHASYRMLQNPGDILWKKEDIKAFRVVESRDDSVKTDLGTPSSKSSHSDNKHPAAVTAEGCSRPRSSYRMCKQCPLRQLMSRIDPVMGQDRRSYPVVAFTCCRKAPAVRSAGTST